MKRALIIVLLILLAALIFLLAWLYTHYEKNGDPNKTFIMPRVELSVIEITELTKEKIKMNTVLVIKNQLPFRIGVDSLRYTIYISNIKVAQSTQREPFFLQVSDTSVISLPVTVFGEKLDSVLSISEQQGLDSVEYKVVSSFYTNMLIKKHFETSITRKLPLLHIPKADIKRVELDSLRANKVVVLAHIFITNKNVFAIKLKDISYRFSVEKDKWIEGKMPGITNIAAHSETPLIVPVKISPEEAGEAFFKGITHGKTADYKMEMRFRTEADNQMIHDSKVIVTSEGSLGELLRFVKRGK
jgi:LEA14-like dessication related protein